MAFLVFLPIVWILAAAGRTIASALRIPSSASILDKNLVGYALGLVLFAYGMLAIGLAGTLYPGIVLGWLAVLLLAGLARAREMAREAISIFTTCFHPPRLVWLTIAVLVFFNGISLIGCFTPPVIGARFLQSIYTEFDSIAYHLADPKLYIQAHRIYPIYWEHHSNFAFTGEMWYTFGLLFHSIPLAKLFHWSCGLAASLAVYRVSLRFLGLRAAAVATILFTSIPLVFWEAGTAYVDLIATYFTTVTLLALAAGIAERDENWIRLSAVLMGCTLASKATAVTTLVLFAMGLLYWRLKSPLVPNTGGRGPKPLSKVAAWCAIAGVIGCPWYVKSVAYTGNPIYPFYYQIFGGKYWGTAQAAAYDQSNASFGLGHQPLNLLLSPWNLTMYLLPGHPAPLYPQLGPGNVGALPFNNFQSELVTIPPVLLAALFVSVFLRLRRTDAREDAALPLESDSFVAGLSLYAAGAIALWFFSMQYARYLLPTLPVLCILAGWVIDRALSKRAMAGYALAGLTILSVGFSGYIAIALAQLQIPVAMGQQTTEEYIQKGFNAYAGMQYINEQLPSGSKIVFYGEPLGFYCDKPYLWGEKGHSTYIPYDRMHNAADLLAFFHSNGVTHVLVNRTAFPWPPQSSQNDWPQWLYQLTQAQSQPIFDEHGIVIYALPKQ